MIVHASDGVPQACKRVMVPELYATRWPSGFGVNGASLTTRAGAVELPGPRSDMIGSRVTCGVHPEVSDREWPFDERHAGMRRCRHTGKPLGSAGQRQVPDQAKPGNGKRSGRSTPAHHPDYRTPESTNRGTAKMPFAGYAYRADLPCCTQFVAGYHTAVCPACVSHLGMQGGGRSAVAVRSVSVRRDMHWNLSGGRLTSKIAPAP